MKIAYLTDRDSVGGGMEYIRRKIAAHPDDETRVFYSCRGECTAFGMDAWGADVVHVNHIKALLQLFRNPFARPKGRVVFTVHGVHLRKYDFLPKTAANRLKRLVRLCLERFLYGRCDGMIALTNADAAEIRRLYGAGLPVVVEPNASAPEEVKPPAGLRYGLDEFAFVCIARFDFAKGVDVLLKAVAIAQGALRSAGGRVLLVGDGPEMPAMRRFAALNGISDLVEFAGEVPSAGGYMLCGRTLVAPSRWEGMPYLLLEAVIRGRSVVASDCAGNSEALKGHARAQFFPVEDAGRLAELMEAAK